MNKKESGLKILKTKTESNKNLPLFGKSNLVFGEGDSDARVMFVGEAPGFFEDKQQRPFVGRAGKLLSKNIESIGWKREQVYITNIIKRRPPNNRDPLPDEIEAYTPCMRQQIKIIKPAVVVALGRFSMNYFLPDEKISKAHGKLFHANNLFIYPLYHPAAALRSTNILRQFEKDFKKLPKILKKITQKN